MIGFNNITIIRILGSSIVPKILFGKRSLFFLIIKNIKKSILNKDIDSIKATMIALSNSDKILYKEIKEILKTKLSKEDYNSIFE